MIEEGLEKRLPFRRVIKQTIEGYGKPRSEGCAHRVVGTLGRRGNEQNGRFEERAGFRSKHFAQTLILRADAHLPYGDIGIKVWDL